MRSQHHTVIPPCQCSHRHARSTRDSGLPPSTAAPQTIHLPICGTHIVLWENADCCSEEKKPKQSLLSPCFCRLSRLATGLTAQNCRCGPGQTEAARCVIAMAIKHRAARCVTAVARCRRPTTVCVHVCICKSVHVFTTGP